MRYWKPLNRGICLGFAILIVCGIASVAWAQTSNAPAGTEASASGSGLDGLVENGVKALTLYLARFVEGAAALVIGIASVRALWAYLVSVVLSRGAGGDAVPKEEIRLNLGRSLALALEFELGADILKTAVAPTWNDVGLLAAIAVLRTALNYFLERELRNAEARDPQGAPRTGAAEPAPQSAP